MLNFLDELERWAEQRASGDIRVSIVFRRWRNDLPKKSADVALESHSALGVVAVWETGELEAEVVAIDSADRIFVFSGVVQDARELRDVLDHAYQATGA